MASSYGFRGRLIVSKLSTLKETLLAVESLADDIISSARADVAEKRYHQLLNEFYADNEDLLASSQYEAAKEDYEYFLRLITLAIAYWEEEAKQKLH